jgi:hypothetical protein
MIEIITRPNDPLSLGPGHGYEWIAVYVNASISGGTRYAYSHTKEGAKERLNSNLMKAHERHGGDESPDRGRCPVCIEDLDFFLRYGALRPDRKLTNG